MKITDVTTTFIFNPGGEVIQDATIPPPMSRLRGEYLALIVVFALVSCGEELDKDAKAICYGFHREWGSSYANYDSLFATYYDEMERALETRQGGKIVRGLLDLVREVKKPGRTADSVWRLERQVLALCGFDVDRERSRR